MHYDLQIWTFEIEIDFNAINLAALVHVSIFFPKQTEIETYKCSTLYAHIELLCICLGITSS